MRAGERRVRIEVDRPRIGRDAEGAPLTGFRPYGSFWGNVTTSDGKFADASGVLLNVERILITIDWQPASAAIEQSWRFRIGATVYDIESIKPDDGRRRDVVFTCTTGENEG